VTRLRAAAIAARTYADSGELVSRRPTTVGATFCTTRTTLSKITAWVVPPVSSATRNPNVPEKIAPTAVRKPDAPRA